MKGRSGRCNCMSVSNSLDWKHLFHQIKIIFILLCAVSYHIWCRDFSRIVSLLYKKYYLWRLFCCLWLVWIWSFLGHFWCDTSWMKGDCRDSECAYYPHKHVTFGDLQNFPKSASHFFEPRYLHQSKNRIRKPFFGSLVRFFFCVYYSILE